MKHKVGDMVTIKADLSVYSYYGPHYCVIPSMEQYRGRRARVLRIGGDHYYNLCIDRGGHSWTESMFEEGD